MEVNRCVFSLVIPAFNSAATINHALNSITGQSFLNWELIVKDGGSSDQTVELVQERASSDRRIRLLSKKDAGIYDGINQALHEAKGEWLIILGSDDSLADKEVLRDMHAILGSVKENFVYGQVKVKGDTGWAKDGDLYAGEFSLADILKKNICHQSIFYRREHLLDRGGFNQKYRICADFDAALEYFSKGDCKFVDRVIADFAGGGESTNARDISFENDGVMLWEKYFGDGLWNKEFSLVKSFFKKEASRQFRAGNLFKAIRYYRLYLHHKKTTV